MSVRASSTGNNQMLRLTVKKPCNRKRRMKEGSCLEGYVGRHFRAVLLLLSLVATDRLVRTSSYPARQVVDLQEVVQ